MNEYEILEGAGKQIIGTLNEYNEQEKLDDTEYIPVVKRVIEALTIYLKENNATDKQSEELTNTLIEYTKGLYIALCQKHAIEDEEDITMEEVNQESDEYFNYVYEHETHPR